MYQTFKLIVLFILGHGGSQQQELEPEFLAPLVNLTVTQGRDVSFTCVVNNLGQYRVRLILIGIFNFQIIVIYVYLLNVFSGSVDKIRFKGYFSYTYTYGCS